MAKALMLAWVSPASDESDAELNEWYEKTHIPQVRAAVPSVTTVCRYRTADMPGGQQSRHRYLAVYELDTTDVAAAAEALGRARTEGRLERTAAVDSLINPPSAQWYLATE